MGHVSSNKLFFFVYVDYAFPIHLGAQGALENAGIPGAPRSLAAFCSHKAIIDVVQHTWR